MAYLVEKAVEMGAASLAPVITARCQTKSVNLERMTAHAIEAAEQSYRLDIPSIAAAEKLDEFIAALPEDTGLIFCDEGGAIDGAALPAIDVLGGATGRFVRWTILIGPEGGFDSKEQCLLRQHPNALSISLGPRILRAETAAVTALTLVQATLGDLSAVPD